MTKRLIIILFLFILIDSRAANDKLVDSLELVYKSGKISVEEKLEVLSKLALNMADEESIKYANELIKIAEQNNNYPYVIRGYSLRGQKYRLLGNFKNALTSFLKANEIAKRLSDKNFLGTTLINIADVYSEIGNSDLAQSYYIRSLEILRSNKNSPALVGALLNAGDDAYKSAIRNKNKPELKRKHLNQALEYYKESDQLLQNIDYPLGKAYNLGNLGMVYAELGEDIVAEEYLNEAIIMLNDLEEHNALPVYYNSIAGIYLRKKDYRSAIKYADLGLLLATQYGYKDQISKSNLTLSSIYEKLGNHKTSLLYYKDYISYRDSLVNLENVQSLADLRTNYEVSQKQTEVDLLVQKRKNQQLISIVTGIAFLFITILALLLCRRYYTVKKHNLLVEKERDISENALKELKITQAQLIQQEKLASFGQLTAGIAHEIKNPLNFINNFSELSMELIEEEKIDISKNEISKSVDNQFLDAIYLNLKKINEHGLRANGIINSMLQFSKVGSGKKEPVFFNDIIKEYVSLCYHGLSISKNPIICEFDYQMDQKIKEVGVIKEDFIRVIINICNNAFDAMRTKYMQSASTPYQPKLTIETKQDGQHIFLLFKDNGPGIPNDILDKIFQPFFTTKKGTEGTGLGLSITNDIIEKHGGVLSVKTVLGEGTAFNIRLDV